MWPINDFDYEKYKGEEVILYGAAVGGKVIRQLLKKYDISVKYFCDRAKVGGNIEGVPVKDPNCLLKEKPDIKVIVTVTRSIDSVRQFFESLDYRDVYSCKSLIEEASIDDLVYAENEKFGIEDFLKQYSLYIDSMNENKIMIPTLEIFITERCTLRCRDCSHLIPKYQGPKDHNVKSLILYISNVMKVVDGIIQILILGGEPFLHSDLTMLLEWINQQNKIGSISIVSNGTIMPTASVMTVLKETKTRVRLSNYGSYSKKITDIVEGCQNNGIACFVSDEPWTDMGEIYNHNYDKKQLKEVFSDCPFAYDLLLLNGKLFRCAHVAHLNNLQMIDSEWHDCVDFSNLEEHMILDKRKELIDYMNIDYLEGCQYCNGIKNSIKGVAPAVQI